MSSKFENIKPGDPVTRLIGGTVPMPMRVTEVDDKFIHCGPWKFSRKNGAEIDDAIGWDESATGSVLRAPDKNQEEE